MLLGWNISMCQEMPSEVLMRRDDIVDTMMGKAQVLVKVESREIEGNILS